MYCLSVSLDSSTLILDSIILPNICSTLSVLTSTNTTK